MFQHLIKTAWRVIWKRKAFSLLNIFGLATGIGASILLFMVIRHELTYDDYHADKDRIYRVLMDVSLKNSGEVQHRNSSTPVPLPDAFRHEFPHLESVAAVWGLGQAQFYVPGKGGMDEEKRFKENEGLFWIEPQAFDIFDFQWLLGNAKRLSEPNTVVLAESVARKFFDNADNAMGKVIQMWSFRIRLEVVGVFKDLPHNTDVPIRVGGSFTTLRHLAPDMFTNEGAWRSNSGVLQTFVKTREGQRTETVSSLLPGFVNKYFPNDPLSKWSLKLQPLKDVHLNKDYETFRGDSLSTKELWSLALIGVFLLLVACVNFINLATAQSINRAREIGVRKVMGSSRGQLIRQFLQETSLITFISILLGCALAVAFLPKLEDVLNKKLVGDLWHSPALLLYLLLTGIIVTFLAGIYPALVLSGFKPVVIFRKKIESTLVGGISLRRGLVVFQFVIAQLLIIGTLVVVKQVKYFRDRPLGFDKDGIVLINLPSDSALKTQYPALKARMEQLSGVKSTALCLNAPANNWIWNTEFTFDNDAQRKDYTTGLHFADTGYFKTFGLKMAAGRIPFASDTIREFVVNEAFVRKAGYSNLEQILGKTIRLGDGSQRAPIVGVVKDYNFKSLHEAIAPVVISTQYNSYEWLAVRMEREKMATTSENVRKLFTSVYPTYLYDTFYFDERIEKFYANESNTAKLFKVFSVLAIVISCLGLYGLVSFMAVQKTKEVGIRKVLGASVKSIVFMFSKEFTILILVAFVIAAPVGYFFMNKWLSGFYYHTSMGLLVFIAAILFSVLIAWITVGYKALKAATVNPVKSLKSE